MINIDSTNGHRNRRDGEALAVGILYENDVWLADLFEALDRRGIPYRPLRLEDASVLIDDPPAYPLVLNRVSPSSYVRGHGAAIPYALALLEILEAHGTRVINGEQSFRVETSKVTQQLLFRSVGVAAPQTILFNDRHEVLERARSFRYPAILKPNCGGSGALVQRIESHEALRALLFADREPFGPDHLLLLQEELRSRDGSVVRTEFIDGELVYAMRARSVNTFNLCPAEACVRQPADPTAEQEPRVDFEPYPDIDPETVDQARRLVRGAGLDVGGVELIEDADGTPHFFDINATSVYRRDLCESVGVDAMRMLVDFVERELRSRRTTEASGGGDGTPRAARTA